MKLISIKVANFGKLDQEFCFAPHSCNVLCAANEFGKTTLADAILFSFYPPPKSGPRDALKPLERYRPWDDDKNAKQRLELELLFGDPPRRYRIEALLGKQPRYTLVDVETNRSCPLANNSFGEEKLKLSLDACLRSFLLRQEALPSEKNGSADLQAVIERAVTAATARDGVSVQQALQRLDNVKLPFRASTALKLDTVIERLEREIEELKERRRNLENERQEQQRDIHELEKLHEEVQKLETAVFHLEADLTHARIQEIAEVLRQQELRKAEHAEKIAKKQELEPYAHYTSEDHDELQRLWGEFSSRSQQLRKLEEDFKRQVTEPLEGLKKELAAYPPSVEKLTKAEAEELKRLTISLEAGERDLREIEQRLATAEGQLAQAGVDVDRVINLEAPLNPLSREELDLILGGYRYQKVTLESQQRETSQRVASAQQECEKLQRKVAGTSRNAALGLALALVAGAAVIAGLLYKLPAVIYGGAGVALMAGVIALLLKVRASNIREHSLRPAREALASAESAATEIRNHLEELERRFEQVRRKTGLATSELLELEGYNPHRRITTEIVKDRETRARLRQVRQENFERACEIARCVNASLSPEPTLQELEQCERALERYLEVRRRHDELLKEKQHREKLIREEKDAIEACQLKIEQILEKAGTPPGKTEERIHNYKNYLDRARRYQEIVAQLENYQILSAQEEEELKKEKARLEQKLEEMGAKDITITSASAKSPSGLRRELEKKLDEARRELKIKEEERKTLLLKCDRIVENYRQSFPAIEEELSRKEETLGRLKRTRRAVELARNTIESLHKEIARNWQRELKEKLQKYLPALLPHYEQPAIETNLELSLRDKETKKVLRGAKELGYLSKGTRDQLDFILRLAIGEVLTSHCGMLPLILDEPFAHWDDERFVQGMHFLVDLAKQRQVILLTCHQWRFDRLKAEHPALYNELYFVSPS